MDSFVCANCQKKVLIAAMGTKNRNHCPYCLFSIHIDIVPGDRNSQCRGLMEPVGKFLKPDGEEMLVHKCQKCAFTRKNRIAGDDDWDKVANLPIVDSF